MENTVINSGAEKIIAQLEEKGFSSYITGGAVMEYLLDKPISSVHISTSASLPEISEILEDIVSIDYNTKTVTVLKNQTGYEISTFRHAPSTFGEKADVYDDLSLAAFSIDAIAYNKREGFLDFFGGVEDIKKKQIRCLLAPEDVFTKNPAAMLRAVRLSVTLGFSIEAFTEKAIRKFSVLAKQIPHNIRLEEFNKLLMSDTPSKGFILMRELGLLKHLLPSLNHCFFVPQKNKYHIYNVGEHIMHALDNTPPDLMLRWAAVLHDIGKPNCLSRDSIGIIHFYGHHRESMKIADIILNSLHLERDLIHDILLLIEYHDVRIEPTLPAIKRLLSKIGDTLFSKLLILQEADTRAKNPAFFEEKLEKANALRLLFRTVIEEGHPYKISDLAINARDLMKLKYKAGRQINDTLRVLLEDVIINPSLNNYTYLINKARNLKK